MRPRHGGADRAFVGQELPPIEVGPITPLQVAYMVVANNDMAAIHVDPDAARKAGLPGLVAPGSFVLGHLGRLVTEWADPLVAHSLEARFREPVFVNDALVVGGRVDRIDGEGAERRVHLALWASKSDGASCATGSAVVGVPRTTSR